MDHTSPTSSCGRCHEAVDDGVRCSSCSKYFHFACGGITEQGYRKLGDRRSSWKCSNCKSANKPSTLSACGPVSPVTTSPLTLENIMQELNKIQATISPLVTLATDIQTIRDDVSELKAVTKTYSNQIIKLEERIDEMDRLKENIVSLNQRVGSLEEELIAKDQWLRANNIEIKGVPQKANENLFDIVSRIGAKITYPVAKTSINFVTRIPSRDKGVSAKAIVVSFVNKYTKEDFVAAARLNKSLSPSDIGLQGSHRIFVNDHLTGHMKQLLSRAKSLASENNFQFVWVKHAKIFVRKDTTSPLFIITKEKDLAKISVNASQT